MTPPEPPDPIAATSRVVEASVSELVGRWGGTAIPVAAERTPESRELTWALLDGSLLTVEMRRLTPV